jgi:hypothetical protein
MLLFPRRIEHTFNVPVQRTHDSDPRKHCWPTVFSNEKQSFHRCLLFSGIVFCLWQFGDVTRGVA